MNPTQRYKRIAQIMDEAYTEYEKGLVTLRKRVVENMRRKAKEGGVLDRPRDGSPARSAPTRKRR